MNHMTNLGPELTADQQRLLFEAEQAEDSAVYLHASGAPAADKAAVAEVLGGPGAGAEFLP